MTKENQSLSTEFRALFAREMGAPYRLMDAQDGLAWQLNGVHYMLRLSFQDWPCEEMPGCPGIINIRIDCEHGIGWVQRRFLPLACSPAALELLRGVKQLFDPRGILNPGKIFP